MSKKPETAISIEVAEVEAKEAAQDGLVAIEELAAAQKVPAWELAALFRAEEWTEGKSITANEFAQARKRLEERAIGAE